MPLNRVALAARFAALIAALTSGCDSKHASHLVQVENAPASQPAAGVAGDLSPVRTPLRLIPFSLVAPKSWEFKSEAGVLILQGVGTAGTIQIGVGKHASPIPEHAARLIEGAKKEAADNPGPLTVADVRKDNDIQILETRFLGKGRDTPAIDADGKIVADHSTPLHWKLSAFVPSGHDTDVCEIYFIDLTREQYDQNKDLLQQITASLQYDPKAVQN